MFFYPPLRENWAKLSLPLVPQFVRDCRGPGSVSGRGIMGGACVPCHSEEKKEPEAWEVGRTPDPWHPWQIKLHARILESVFVRVQQHANITRLVRSPCVLPDTELRSVEKQQQKQVPVSSAGNRSRWSSPCGRRLGWQDGTRGHRSAPWSRTSPVTCAHRHG